MSRSTRRLFSGDGSKPPAPPVGGETSPPPRGQPVLPVVAEGEGPTVVLARPSPRQEQDDDGPTLALVRRVADGEGRGASEPLGVGQTVVMRADDEPTAPAVDAKVCPLCGVRSSAGAKFCPYDGTPLERAADWNPHADPLLGKVVAGRYRVEHVVAEGGMGTIYRVRHTKLESAFAMKVLRRDLAEDPEVAARLVEEARATANIGHPNIVSVADFGEIDSEVLPELGSAKLPFFVMEYLRGPSLAELLESQGQLPAEQVAHLCLQVAGALGAAHKAGIVHRDLKPSNIRVTRDELRGEVVKVLDFGVAKVMGASTRTQQGMVFGTPHYMSPEQGQGRAVDLRSDIYALGIIMYECLTGKVPFQADTFMGVITKHMFQRPEPRQWPGGVPLESILMRCLEKDPLARYQSMDEVVIDLERALEGRGRAPASSGRRGFRLRDEEQATGGRVTMPGAHSARGWWLVAAVALLAAAGYLVYRSANGVPSEPSTAPASASVPPAAATEATATPSAAAAAAPPQSTVGASAPPEPAASLTTTPQAKGTTPLPGGKPSSAAPPPRPRGGTGDGIVDPWSN